MGGYRYICMRLDLEEKLDACIDKTLGECDSAGVFERARTNPKITGIAGDVVEQSIIGYPPNSDQEPDLIVDGVTVELKTTGLRPSKRGAGLEAKEPMTITAVSLDKIAAEEFETSAFWHKADRMLIVYYLYDSDSTVTAIEYELFPIKGYQFHTFTPEEEEMLRADWQLVHDFIADIQTRHPDEEGRRSEYPLLSSALRHDLMLIDTAPKYPHPPRFRLKRTTVTAMARKCFGYGYEQLDRAYSSYREVDAALHEAAKQLVGRTVGDICAQMGLPATSKNVCEQIIVRIFGGSARKMDRIELFAKIGLKAKTVVTTKEGRRTEDLKLFTIDFDEFDDAGKTFEDSLFYEYFDSNQLLCVVLEEPSTQAPLSDNVFKGFKRLSFGDDLIEGEVRRVWERIRHLVLNCELEDVPVLDSKTGRPAINKTGVVRSAPNLPKSREGDVFVRGTSSNSAYKPVEVGGVRMYRQQVWIKGTYIVEQLAKLDWI